jgi:hypothetical protein
VYDFPLTVWVPASHPYKISWSRHSPVFRLLLQCTWGLCSSGMLHKLTGSRLPTFWDNLSIPSPRVKHQDPWKWNRQVVPKRW